MLFILPSVFRRQTLGASLLIYFEFGNYFYDLALLALIRVPLPPRIPQTQPLLTRFPPGRLPRQRVALFSGLSPCRVEAAPLATTPPGPGRSSRPFPQLVPPLTANKIGWARVVARECLLEGILSVCGCRNPIDTGSSLRWQRKTITWGGNYSCRNGNRQFYPFHPFYGGRRRRCMSDSQTEPAR